MNRGDSLTRQALSLALAGECFCTPEGQPYATVAVNGHRETYRIAENGDGYRSWLRGQFFAATGRPLCRAALADVIATVAATARAAGVVHPVYTRVAAAGEALYLDLGDASWRVVEITAGGWRVVEEAPVRFRRPRGLQPLPVPLRTRGPHLMLLQRFLNLGSEADTRLVIGWLLAALRPAGPYPLLALHGERGCAKSTATRFLKALIDPGVPPSRDLPRDARDLAIAAGNGWVLAYDNLSRLPDWLSDAFCRLATGGGFATRKLHTDDEESLFWAQRPIVMNGIEELATRGDLLDRALVLTLPVIPGVERREEAQLEALFEQARGALLGALLEVAAGALKALPATRLPALPRMADFARWVAAAEPALGWEPGAFSTAYQENRAGAVSLEIEASPIGQAIQRLLIGHPTWEGTATALLEALTRLAPDLAESRSWPRNGRYLSGDLQRVAPGLRASGIAVTAWREIGGNRVRMIRLERPAST